MFRFIIFMAMCLLYILQALIPSTVIQTIFILICLIAFFLAFRSLKVKNKVLTGVLFSAGILIHYFYGNSGLDLLEGLTQNLALLVIILLAPLIFLPLEGEGVIKTVTSKLEEWKEDKRKLFFGISGFMVALGPILNMGAIRVVHGFVGKLPIDKKLLSHAYFGGFNPAVIWSPFFASVGVVITIAELPYITYMPVGIGFAVLMSIIAFLLFRPKKNGVSFESEKLHTNSVASRRDVLLLVCFVVFLIILLIILEYLTKLPMLLLVALNCIFIPLLWTLVRNKWEWVRGEIKVYKNQLISNSNMEISLFLSAGLFGNALMHTPIASGLANALFWASEWSVLLVFLFVVFFVTMMALFGIHQIISIPIMLPLLLMPEVEVSLFAAAFMCIFTWMFSASLSPLNALNIIISSCVHVNGIKVGICWNGKYFLATFIIAMGYILLLNQL